MNERRAPEVHLDGASATAAEALCFGPFRLDLRDEQLWRGKSKVALQPKTFTVLRYLAERPQRLITKQELLDALWADVCVGDAVLKTHLREIRVALRDDVKSPRFIETAHRRGYRFIASVEQAAPTPATVVSTRSAQRAERARESSSFVGRESELGRLEESLERALGGALQAIFISGDAGAGKTTLANTFLGRLEERADLWLARGQCIEQYGAGEAYLPVLEAFGRLCRQRGERIIEVLRRQAPTWLVQLPGLLDAAELASLARTTAATSERMLREMAEAIVSLSEERALVLSFEDLHWADYSTLHLISYLARRADPARVMILGTYRPRSVLDKDHPLATIQQDLLVSGRAQELSLADLDERATAQYLDARFSGHQFPPELVVLIRQRTHGNPLFLVRLVDFWLQEKSLLRRDGIWQVGVEVAQLARGVPLSLSRMIEREIEHLSELDRSVLQAASVVGVEFSVLAVAAALEEDVVRIEEVCAAWARKGQFVRLVGKSEWPDGSVSLRCAFNHGLYQQVAYDRIAMARAGQLHRRVGIRLEAAHGARPASVATELALHFERAQEFPLAVRYLVLAGELALSRSAYREATDHLAHGLELAPHLPQGPDRLHCEMQLELARGAALAMTRGYTSPEVERAYARAKELCSSLGDRAVLFPVVLAGIWQFHLIRGDCRTLGELGQQLFALAQQQDDPQARGQAQLMFGVTCFYLVRLTEARTLLEQVLPVLDAENRERERLLYREDSSVFARSQLSWILWVLGYPDQALCRAEEAVLLAQELDHPFTLVFARFFHGAVLYLRREYAAALAAMDAVLSLATAQGFTFYVAVASMARGSILAIQGEITAGLPLFERGWAIYSATGAGVSGPYYRSVWAVTLALAGRLEEALSLLAEALEVARRNYHHGFDPEIHRLQGEISWQLARGRGLDSGHAESHFAKALDSARQSGARSFELRSALSLARLWREQGKRSEVHSLLSRLLASFDEGFDTPDLQDAQQLLADLSSASADTATAPRPATAHSEQSFA